MGACFFVTPEVETGVHIKLDIGFHFIRLHWESGGLERVMWLEVCVLIVKTVPSRLFIAGSMTVGSSSSRRCRHAVAFASLGTYLTIVNLYLNTKLNVL